MKPLDVSMGVLVLALAGSAYAQDSVLQAGPPPAGSAPREAHATPEATPPIEDAVGDDALLPEGTVVVTLLDENERPRPRAALTVGVLQQSVAKGDSRKQLPVVTDELGNARVAGLSSATETAYSVSTSRDGARYASRPFNLPKGKGVRVRLHAYPASAELADVRLELQGVLAFDLKDDRLQIEQLLTVLNVGRTAWVPSDLVLGLPADFQALRGNSEMGDIAVDPVEGRGARIRGTFAPGRSDVQFTWQVPYHGTERIDVDVGMPPELAMLRVIAVAAPKMRLSVDGFPDAVARTDGQGQRVLVTEWRSRGAAPSIGRVHVQLTDIPAQGPATKLVTTASVGLMLLSVGWAFRRKVRGLALPAYPKAARARWLAELEELERARRDGDVGPKTYETARRNVISGIAGTLSRRTEHSSSAPADSHRASRPKGGASRAKGGSSSRHRHS